MNPLLSRSLVRRVFLIAAPVLMAFLASVIVVGAQSPQFSMPPATISGFSGVRGLAVGDLNGDGKADLVGASVSSHSVIVALGDGAGEFTSVGSYPSGPSPQRLALGDFSGDGNLDVAVVHGGNVTAAVMFGDGAGSLGAPTVYSFPSSYTMQTPVAGDFNGDGMIDLAVSVSGPTLSFSGHNGYVYVGLNSGFGGLVFPPTPLTTPPVGNGSSAAVGLAAADLDGDGALDLVVTDQLNQFQNLPATHVYWGNGAGGFTGPQNLPFAAGPISNETQGVTLADLDGDVLPEVIVASYVYRPGGGSVTIFHNNGGRTFGSPVSLRAARGAQPAAVGDINNDGFPDLVVANHQDAAISYYLNDGGGNLGASGSWSGLFSTSSFPWAPATLGDFDGNGSGWLDIVYSVQAAGDNARLVTNGTIDSDGDGVPDDEDAFPDDPSESVDSDDDGVGDSGDNCLAVANSDQSNTDGDGSGDACDADDDNDGVEDGSDAFPLDAGESVDTDGDGIGNNADPDDDGDGVADGSDAFPLDASESVDSDHDGIGNNADPDDDNDGVPDSSDPAPTNPDRDGDGVLDGADPYPDSNTSPTVIIDGNDSGVVNRSIGSGTTLADSVLASSASCAAGAKNHGAYVSCMAHELNALKAAGTITGAEKGALQSAAAKK